MMNDAGLVRVTCVQMMPNVSAGALNIQHVTSALQDAVVHGSQLVVVPELATTGYVFSTSAEARANALGVGDPVVDTWAEILAANDAVAVVGFAELGADGRLYNAAAVIGANGLLHVYRKLHLWDQESKWFSAGDQAPSVVSTSVGRIGVLVCYDLEFPEAVRILALDGAEIVVVPTHGPATVHPPDDRPSEIIDAQSAARLNRVWIACADRVGDERGVAFTGGSCVIDPNGWVVAELPDRDEGVVTADIDPTRAREKRSSPTNHVLADRRPDLYGRLVVSSVRLQHDD